MRCKRTGTLQRTTHTITDPCLVHDNNSRLPAISWPRRRRRHRLRPLPTYRRRRRFRAPPSSRRRPTPARYRQHPHRRYRLRQRGVSNGRRRRAHPSPTPRPRTRRTEGAGQTPFSVLWCPLIIPMSDLLLFACFSAYHSFAAAVFSYSSYVWRFSTHRESVDLSGIPRVLVDHPPYADTPPRPLQPARLV